MLTRVDLLWEQALFQCCHEPVDRPGYIQPFGALIGTDIDLEQITHVSGNLAMMLGHPSDDPNVGRRWLGQPLATILSAELIHDLCNACGLPWIRSRRERLGIYEIQGQPLEVSVHVRDQRTLIELEPVPTHPGRSIALVSRIQALLQTVQDSASILTRIAAELRQTTGFDRIMVYRFLPNGAGEVVSEAKACGVDSFLGFRFPATDIPERVRDLLLTTHYRVIPDTQATPVPIFAWDQAEAPLDLSLACLRGAAPVHTQQYLKNMGVRASLTVALTVHGKLWGLFACHHRQVKHVTSEVRAAVEMCGMVFSLFLQQLAAEQSLKRQQAARSLTQLFRELAISDNSWATRVVQTFQQLCELLSSHGVALVADHTSSNIYGDVPPQEAITALSQYIASQHKTDIVLIDSLAQIPLPKSVDWASSAGGLVIAVTLPSPHYLIFFRNELISEVRWAGPPPGPEIFQKAETLQTPARSFAEYTEIVRDYCRPWDLDDQTIAGELRIELQKQISLCLQCQLHLTIAELNHRVKNILALIHSVARQTRRSTQSVADYTALLEQRILALSKAHELVTTDGQVWPGIKDLLEIELRPYLAEASSQVMLLGQDVKLSANFVPTFVLVLHELVSNAAKYGALSVPEGQLMVRWFKHKGGLNLHWQESQGPAVIPPSHRGFGCELIERAIPYEFSGEAALHFTASGVEANFWLPDELLQWLPLSAVERPAAIAPTAADPVSPTETGSVLVVEDNMMIAIEMESTLKTLGFEKVDSSPTVSQALELLSQNQYQICFLDINLKKETSFKVAYELIKRKLPFVFTTGYDSNYSIPEDLKSAFRLKKPVNEVQLSKALQQILQP